MALAEEILRALSSVLPGNGFNPLHEPTFKGNEWKYLKDCIDTGWVSTVGKYVDRFEEMLARLTGSGKAVAVVNGTAALHISLLLVGVKPKEEVVVPAFTFVATANAVSYLGAVPHFADSEQKTLGIDPWKLKEHLEETVKVNEGQCFNRKTGRRIAAVVPMHTFGHPVDLDSLMTVCDGYHLPVVEDAAESLGSYYKGRHTGGFGKLGILSFNGNKIVTTGGGGAILTDDEKIGKLAKHLTTTAKVPHRWEYFHDRPGYNYRLPNINAALGCAQLESLSDYLNKKRMLAEKYRKAFEGICGVSFFTEPEDCKSNYWLNTILLESGDLKTRNEILEKTNEAGFMTRPAWTLMHRLPMYKDCPRMDLSVAESLDKRIINIPSGSDLYV